MDYLLIFFILIIACIIGISIGLLLEINSYLKIAFLVLCLFIPMELYSQYRMKKKHIKPVPNSQAQINTSTTQNSESFKSVHQDITQSSANEEDLEDTNYAIFKRTDSKGIEKNSLPLDNLDPKTLLSKLSYIHYATANPLKKVSYVDFKTQSDKILEEDGNIINLGTKLNKLNNNNERDRQLKTLSQSYYPQLTDNQIDTTDCLNYGSDPNKSCFQSPQLFYNINHSKTNPLQNPYSILSKGVNDSNSNLIIKEDFSNPMILNAAARNQHILFKNAPQGNLDKILDSESNESIILDDSSHMCRTCKLGVCSNDYCSLQNKLFM